MKMNEKPMIATGETEDVSTVYILETIEVYRTIYKVEAASIEDAVECFNATTKDMVASNRTLRLYSKVGDQVIDKVYIDRGEPL